jgi:hypothetical protein
MNEIQSFLAFHLDLIFTIGQYRKTSCIQKCFMIPSTNRAVALFLLFFSVDVKFKESSLI